MEPQGRVGVRRWLPWPCLRLLSGDRGLPARLRRTQAYLGPHDAQNSLHGVKKPAGAGQGPGVGRTSGDSPGRPFFEEGPRQSPRSRVLLPWQVGLREGSSPHGQLMENARSACVFLCAAVKSCWWEGTPGADPTTPPQGHRAEAGKWDPRGLQDARVFSRQGQAAGLRGRGEGGDGLAGWVQPKVRQVLGPWHCLQELWVPKVQQDMSTDEGGTELETGTAEMLREGL